MSSKGSSSKRKTDPPSEGKSKMKSISGMEISTRVPDFLVPLVVLDKQLTARLSICAGKESSFISLRPYMKFFEFSCHGIPWLAGCVAFLMTFRSEWSQDILVNVFTALIIDIILVGILKAVVRRARPSANNPDMFATFSVDAYAFPSGHASRAIMLFMIFAYKSDISMIVCAALALWSAVVCVSRVLLGRHHVGDIIGGVLLGIFEYKLMTLIWMTPETAYSILSLLYYYDSNDT